LVTEPEDEDARQDLLGREQGEAAGVPPEFQLRFSRGGESDGGQSICKRGVTCLVEGCKPLIEEVAGRGVGDVTYLVAHARKAHKDGGVNGAHVGSGRGGHRSALGIAEDDGVHLVWIVIILLAGAGGTISAGAAGTYILMSGMTHGIENCGERTDGGNDREQNGCWAERLAASDIEVGSRECGDHTDSVDALPNVA
jgi:hypothetical protein